MLLIDRFRLSREALRALLERDPSLHVVADVEAPAEAVAVPSAAKAHMVLAIPRLPSDCDGALVSALRGLFPELPILVLTPPVGGEKPAAALAAGADGIVTSDASCEVVVKAIHSLCSGEVWARRSDLRETLRLLRPSHAAGGQGPGLTRREAEVLQLLAEGMPTGEIARSLAVSTSTVRVHTSRILSKLGVPNRVAAVRAAVRRGLVTA